MREDSGAGASRYLPSVSKRKDPEGVESRYSAVSGSQGTNTPEDTVVTKLHDKRMEAGIRA